MAAAEEEGKKRSDGCCLLSPLMILKLLEVSAGCLWEERVNAMGDVSTPSAAAEEVEAVEAAKAVGLKPLWSYVRISISLG